jgi:hypothetical protein
MTSMRLWANSLLRSRPNERRPRRSDICVRRPRWTTRFRAEALGAATSAAARAQARYLGADWLPSRGVCALRSHASPSAGLPGRLEGFKPTRARHAPCRGAERLTLPREGYQD